MFGLFSRKGVTGIKNVIIKCVFRLWGFVYARKRQHELYACRIDLLDDVKVGQFWLNMPIALFGNPVSVL
jgi:hypothetical protein